MKCYNCKKEIERKEFNRHYGMHKKCLADVFGDLKFKNIVETKEGKKDVFLSNVNSSYFHGAFKKYSAMMGEEYYLFKLPQEGFKYISVVEYATNKMAQALEIPVPKFSLINLRGEKIFVTKNFMQNYNMANLIHIYHYLEGREANYNIKYLISKIKELSDNSEDYYTFIKVCIFDALVGNIDRHGRNLALIDIGSKVFLSPIYDSVSFLATTDRSMRGEDLSAEGAIGISGVKRPMIRDYIEGFIELGCKKEVMEYLALIRKTDIEKIISESLLINDVKKAFIKFVKKSLKSIADV